jgi:DNA-binding response OmpR family regulator
MITKPKHLLVVDDESKILGAVTSYMESHGFTVFPAETGRQALDIFNRENISLVVLDLMLPDISGEDVCREIRKISRTPIIMLTAKVDEKDLLDGFDMGADDYITKPFSLKELNVRVEAALRRAGDDLVPLVVKNSFRDGDLTVDFEKNMIKKRGLVVSLTPSELKILAALIRHPGKVFTRNELIERALGDEFDGYDRTVDNYIKNLRQKIEDDSKNPNYILTIYGLGYKFGGM